MITKWARAFWLNGPWQANSLTPITQYLGDPKAGNFVNLQLPVMSGHDLTSFIYGCDAVITAIASRARSFPNVG